MASLEELRRWMAGEDVLGLPARSSAWDRRTPPRTARREDGTIAEAGAKPIGVKDASGHSFWHPDAGTLEADVATSVAAVLAEEAGETEPPPFAAGTGTRKRVRVPGGSEYKLTSDGRDAVLTSGRHSGRTLTEVASDDPTYLRWIIEDHREKPRPPEFIALVNAIYSKTTRVEMSPEWVVHEKRRDKV